MQIGKAVPEFISDCRHTNDIEITVINRKYKDEAVPEFIPGCRHTNDTNSRHAYK